MWAEILMKVGKAMTDTVMKPLPIELSLQTVVWRYLPLRRLYAAIKTKHLSLTLLKHYRDSPDGDPYETSVPENTKEIDLQTTGARSTCFSTANQIACKPYPTSQFDPNESLVRLEQQRRAVLRAAYASCWRWGDESEAMWRLYCPGSEGVAICSTFEKLQRSFRDDSMVVSPIAYIDYEKEFTRHQNTWDPALHKRTAFAYEQEVRVLRFDEKNYQRACEDEEYCPKTWYEVPWNPDEVVDKIVLNPRCDDAYRDLVIAALKTLSPDLSDKVQKSGLAPPLSW